MKVFRTPLGSDYLPKYDQPDLQLVSETYKFIESCLSPLFTENIDHSDICFVPINLIEWQFRNLSPSDFLKHLPHLDSKPHFIVALGDFSNRTRVNRNGKAYKKTFKWLEKFHLLALENTSDLLEGRDLGIIPINTIVEESISPHHNNRPIEISFLGNLSHDFLPRKHIRRKIKKLYGGNNGNDKSFVIWEKFDSNLFQTWTGKTVSNNPYRDLGLHSEFTLCPAGYGAWTYRFFNSIKWGSIPILLSDHYRPPFSPEIPWDRFILRVPEKRIKDLRQIVCAISVSEREHMKGELEKNQSLFTPEKIKDLLLHEMEKLVIGNNSV